MAPASVRNRGGAIYRFTIVEGRDENGPPFNREVAPGCQLVPLGGAEGVILDVRRLDELGHWHLLVA